MLKSYITVCAIFIPTLLCSKNTTTNKNHFFQKTKHHQSSMQFVAGQEKSTIKKAATLPPYYPVSFSKGTKLPKHDRYITGIALGNMQENVKDNTLAYHDLTKNAFTARIGEQLIPKILYSGRWMDGYVYIDKNQNGQFDVLPIGKKGYLSNDNDIVSFSALGLPDGKYNSAGKKLNNLNTLYTPAFSLPKNFHPGFYMMRYNVDWNTADPAGGKDIIKHRGGIVDIRLSVWASDSVKIYAEASPNGELLDYKGNKLQGTKAKFGEQTLEIYVHPKDGYTLSSLRIRHGNLEATDSIKNGVAQYTDEYYTSSDIQKGIIYTHFNIDGDIHLYPIFRKTENSSKNPKRYKLVFDDEFNLPDGSQPNPKYWSSSKRYKGTWNRYIANSDKVIYIKNGCMVARAIPNPDKTTDDVPMITGAMETINKFSFTYGRIDVRMKCATHVGSFPAAWLMPNPPTKQWPKAGEIDIFEGINANNRAFHTVHSNWTYNLKHKNNPPSSGNEFVTIGQWHVYSVEWEPEEIRWYVDGKQVFSYAKSKNKNDLAQGQWPFTHPFYIILNQSVGDGGWVAKPDLNYVYETQFDYVRVYQEIKTAISPIERNHQDKDNAYYNLSGEKVSSPEKGLYIHKGKKIFIK